MSYSAFIKQHGIIANFSEVPTRPFAELWQGTSHYRFRLIAHQNSMEGFYSMGKLRFTQPESLIKELSLDALCYSIHPTELSFCKYLSTGNIQANSYAFKECLRTYQDFGRLFGVKGRDELLVMASEQLLEGDLAAVVH